MEVSEEDKTVVSIDILCEFLEVAIHAVLYTRELYPRTVFVKKKKYGIPVQMSVHPYLSEYITECVTAIHTLLQRHEVERVAIVIVNPGGVPIEKFVFEILQRRSAKSDKDPYYVRLEQALRAFCLKLSVCDAFLKPLPGGCSFRVQVHTTEGSSVALAEDAAHQEFPWIEVEKQQAEVAGSRLVPVKSLESPYFDMQLYIEEGSEKQC